MVSHRNGRRDLVLYDVDDPDACLASIPLTDDEAEALADVLGASLMLGQLAGLRQQAAGLLTEQIAIPAGSPFVGRKLGDTRARTRTSASIVAVLRDREVIASPGPVLRLRGERRGGRRRHPRGPGRRDRHPRRRRRLRPPVHSTTILLIEVGALLFALGMLGRLGRRFGLSPDPALPARRARVRARRPHPAVRQRGVHRGRRRDRRHPAAGHAGPGVFGQRAGRQPARRRRPAGLIDALLNALPGAGFALLLGWGWEAALVLAGITWVSSSGVIAKVLGDLGRLGNRETPVILSVLVIEDLAMAFYLPLVTAVLAGVGLLGGAKALAVAVVTVVAVLVVAIRYGHAISSFMSVKDAEALLLSVLGLTLFVAGVAAELKVSAAVGAFLVGIALSGPVAHHATADPVPAAGPVRRRLLRLLRPLHRPGRHAAGAAARAGAGRGHHGDEGADRLLAAKRVGIAVPGRLRAGLALMPRGEFSIVIAGLAVASGVEPRARPARHGVRADHRGDRPDAGAVAGLRLVQGHGPATHRGTASGRSRCPPATERPRMLRSPVATDQYLNVKPDALPPDRGCALTCRRDEHRAIG